MKIHCYELILHNIKIDTFIYNENVQIYIHRTLSQHLNTGIFANLDFKRFDYFHQLNM